MMRLNTLKPAPGSRHRRKIVGRGEGSGHGGKGSTRGFKGQTARSGDSHMKHGFEGGQIPLIRRIPKRGFKTTAFRTEYAVVNVGDIEAVMTAPGEVTVECMKKAGLVKGADPVKVLGDGDVTKAFHVKAHAFSGPAKEKLEKAGGRAELVPGPKAWKRK